MAMAMDLSPKFSKQIFEGEGGSYKSWSNDEFPLLGESKVGGGLLVLKPGGFAFPHYADCSKLGLVLEGEHGSVGMVLPKDKASLEETVLRLGKGDIIPVPVGAVSWWYNYGSSDVVIVFLGETTKAYVPGEFTYFLLTGGLGILSGFSTEFTSRAYNMKEKEANELARSQTGVLIIKLDTEQQKIMPQPNYKDSEINKWVKNIVDIAPEVRVEKGGTVSSFTGMNFPFVEETGLSCRLVVLDANAMLSPTFSADCGVTVFYVAKGNGKVQMLGINSRLVLDTQIEKGQVFIVPRFFTVGIIANGQGMELFSMITTTRPAIGELAGKKSVLNAISPSVVQLGLNATPQSVKDLKTKMANNEILIPPMI